MRPFVQVKVPASTANLGPGFDTIGMAFQLYTTIRMMPADSPRVILHGEELQELPIDQTNLVYRMAEYLFEKANKKLPPICIEMKSEVPLTRGLGSSAAAIVGGLVAANYLAEEPFTQDEIFTMAANLEGHPDNVGASLYGGIVVAVMDEGQARHIKIDPLPDLQAIAVIPDFQLSTEKARSVLPSNYTRTDTVYSLGHASLLVGALASGRYDVLRFAMRDRIHQPYRTALVPGMSKLLEEAHEYGALGTALSGAGPTIISLLTDKADRLEQFFRETLLEQGIGSTTIHLVPDTRGVQISEDIDTPF
ncbi:MAG TPA: homoserine kinase [Bacillota bacterium]|nr:homoserine kinase [Bacillota bacterium]